MPEIDLARIAPLPRDQKRRQLEQMRLGRPPYSYRPVRRTFGDIFNIQTELFGPAEPSSWGKVAEVICQTSRSQKEEEANLSVAKALHDFACQNKLQGRCRNFRPFPLGLGERVQYALPMVLALNETAMVPFIDPRRRSKRLTMEGRRFVFSVMHEHIRAADPDYSNVTLGIFQFSTDEADTRATILHTEEGVELFDFNSLDFMIRETYELWAEICEGRAEETRRRAGGMRGDLL